VDEAEACQRGDDAACLLERGLGPQRVRGVEDEEALARGRDDDGVYQLLLAHQCLGRVRRATSSCAGGTPLRDE